MKNLNDMNDLYSVQDVILLLEIVENRFGQMYKKITTTPENLTQQVLQAIVYNKTFQR